MAPVAVGKKLSVLMMSRLPWSHRWKMQPSSLSSHFEKYQELIVVCVYSTEIQLRFSNDAPRSPDSDTPPNNINIYIK